MKYAFLLFVFCFNHAFSQELRFLYEKNTDIPRTSRESQLVQHTQKSLAKALQFESKLNDSNFSADSSIKIWPSDVPSDHFFNNICELEGASHLHVGLLRGGSFIAALYGNQHLLKDQIGMDWFQEFPKNILEINCSRYLDSNHYQLFDCDCFNINKALFTAPVDIYFYDADHCLKAHEKAFTYYNDLFADTFIAIVDDWKCPWIRRATFKAFEKLDYQILYETLIPDSPSYGHGQYIAVIRKSKFAE